MKRRIKKKGVCTHLFDGESFLVTDDPYPIYNNELYCKLGKFDWTWNNREKEFPCDKCTRFRLSRSKQRAERQKYKDYKLDCAEAKRYYRWHPQKDIKVLYEEYPF